MKTYVVIPARGGSKRLNNKNICSIWDMPMIYWGIMACKYGSLYISDVFVSTEDSAIKTISLNLNVKVIDRPPELAGDEVYKQDVIAHAVKQMAEKPDIVISLQPNSPEVRPVDLDNALEKLIKYDRNEVFSVDSNLIQNAAFRVMKCDYVFQKSISTKCGVFVTDYVDIHNIEDLEYVEKNRSPWYLEYQKIRGVQWKAD